MPVSTRSMLSPMAADTAMDRLRRMARSEIAPWLSSSTCRFRVCTAGSALMMNQPITMATGTSRCCHRGEASCCPST